MGQGRQEGSRAGCTGGFPGHQRDLDFSLRITGHHQAFLTLREQTGAAEDSSGGYDRNKVALQMNRALQWCRQKRTGAWTRAKAAEVEERMHVRGEFEMARVGTTHCELKGGVEDGC